jgi:hypothetical protein
MPVSLELLVQSSRRVIVISGTGFLGYQAIQEFLDEGWNVTALSLPPYPPAYLYPATVRVVSLPTRLIKTALYGLWLMQQLLGRETGLDPRYFAPLQTAETFLDLQPSREALGYQTGGFVRHFKKQLSILIIKKAIKAPYLDVINSSTLTIQRRLDTSA